MKHFSLLMAAAGLLLLGAQTVRAQSDPNITTPPPASTWDGPTIISSGNIAYEYNYDSHPTNPWTPGWNNVRWVLDGSGQRNGTGFITNSGGITYRYTLHPATYTSPTKNSWTLKTQVYASATGTNVSSAVVAGGTTSTTNEALGNSTVNFYKYVTATPYVDSSTGKWTLDFGASVWGHVEQKDQGQPWHGDVWVGFYSISGALPY